MEDIQANIIAGTQAVHLEELNRAIGTLESELVDFRGEKLNSI